MDKKKKFHFIAIGGIGMSGLAKYLIERGFEVSGSDVCDSKYVDKLRHLGAKVFIGHDEKNLPDDCIVVVSTAIHKDNPELVKAKNLNLKIMHRSDLLAFIANNCKKCFIGFCGTHGKTTTSGLCSYVLDKAGFKPSFVDGGIVPELNTNAQYKKGRHFVAELDESDGTIIKYRPQIAVINNLEEDHIDHYQGGLDDIISTFKLFLNKSSAKILLNIDDKGVQQLKEFLIGDIYTFGIKSYADFYAQNINQCADFTTFDVYYKNTFMGEFKIILKGIHNVYNALAVIGALYLSGVDANTIKKHFATFTGMGRRFQKIGTLKSVNVDVYDDYAHHPTEIMATLDATKSLECKRLVAVFQPHRYTRLKSLWNDFKLVLGNFEGEVFVTDVFEASESPIEGITGENFAREINGEYLSGNMENVAKALLPQLKDGDVVIGMGAGTITELGKYLLQFDEKAVKIGG